MKIQFLYHDFLHLFFPKLCKACDAVLLADEQVICTTCVYHLPFTNFHIDPKNETAQQLWGKLEFQNATSMLYLARSSRVEQLLHRLKYKNEPEIGIYLGEMYAKQLMNVDWIKSVDSIIPVPIHTEKLRKRGYNQAEQFAKGLANVLDVELDLITLIRHQSSKSQTQMRRIERYENVESVFSIKNNSIEGKHVLLVDDVLTTGATICSAGNILIEAGAQVSVITLARA